MIPFGLDWGPLAIYAAGTALLVIVGEALHHFLRVSDWLLRKAVHLLTGVAIAFTPWVFAHQATALVLASAYILANALSWRFGLLKAMESEGQYSLGTVFYGVAFLAVVAVGWSQPVLCVLLPMLVMGVADPVAAFVGRSWGRKRYANGKSLIGSAAFFLCALGLMGGILGGMRYPEYWLIASAIALLLTVAEGVAVRGMDNLSVPLLAAWSLWWVIQSPANLTGLVLGIGFAGGAAIAAFRLRSLTGLGAGTAFLVGTVIFGAGGWAYATPLLLFFATGSVLSHLGSARKRAAQFLAEKGGRRDSTQVLANGGIATLLAALGTLGVGEWVFPAYLASLAAVTADTWSTEIGTLSPSQPRSIVTGRRVLSGTSGGVTPLGFLAALAGGLAIAEVGLRLGAAPYSCGMLFPIVAAGFVGSAFDSLLGATLQSRRRCAVCGSIAEKAAHCGRATEFAGGLRWLDNDGVNLLCALAGVVLYLMIGILPTL